MPQRETRAHSDDAALWLVNGLILQNVGAQSYPKARLLISSFCCKEALPPERLCRVLEVQKYTPKYLPGPTIAADLPLRWTYLAYQLGWAQA
jgi:hypothetical protein